MAKRLPDAWTSRKEWKPFGNRLDFLSPERQHLQTGRLTILPSREKKGIRDGEK